MASKDSTSSSSRTKRNSRPSSILKNLKLNQSQAIGTLSSTHSKRWLYSKLFVLIKSPTLSRTSSLSGWVNNSLSHQCLTFQNLTKIAQSPLHLSSSCQQGPILFLTGKDLLKRWIWRRNAKTSLLEGAWGLWQRRWSRKTWSVEDGSC